MQFFISTIWFFLSSLLIYNVFYDSIVSTFGYIVLCLISVAPLAGCIIFESLKDDKDLDKISQQILVTVLLGLIVGFSVSIVDFFFFSKGFLDFFLDLVEIGFGYFAPVSYYVGALLFHISKLRENKLKQRERIAAIEISNEAARMRQIRLMNERESEERKKRLKENRSHIRYEIIKIINNNLSRIISEGVQSEKCIAYGEKGNKEIYYASEYPIKKLKDKTERFVKKLAQMSKNELDSFFQENTTMRN